MAKVTLELSKVAYVDPQWPNIGKIALAIDHDIKNETKMYRKNVPNSRV